MTPVGYMDHEEDEVIRMTYNEAAELSRRLNEDFPELLVGRRLIFRPIPFDEADSFTQYQMLPEDFQERYFCPTDEATLEPGTLDLPDDVEENPSRRRAQRWMRRYIERSGRDPMFLDPHVVAIAYTEGVLKRSSHKMPHWVENLAEDTVREEAGIFVPRLDPDSFG